MTMNEQIRTKLISRANRAAGQANAVQKMIQEDRYCVEVLNQIAAARSALDALGVELLTAHIDSCVAGQGTETQHKCAESLTHDELLTEVRTVLKRFLK